MRPCRWTPFGLVRASAATSAAPVNPFGFSGEYRDDSTGLLHLRARQYDPGTGRFTALDPVSPGVGEPYVSAYAYVANNPVRWVDPSGRCLGPLIFLLPACIGAAAGVLGYVGGTVTVNLVDNYVRGRDLFDDVGRDLNLADAAISAGAGALAGPFVGLAFTPTRIGAGAALGCSATFASQAIGNRESRLKETMIGCLSGGAGVIYRGNSAVLGVAFGIVVSTAQSIATWAFGK